MLAPVSNTRAQHDGFAVVVIVLVIIVACVAGYWYAASTGAPAAPADAVSVR